MIEQINFKGQNYSTDDFISKIINDIEEPEFYGNFEFYISKYTIAQLSSNNKFDTKELKNKFLTEILFASHSAFIRKIGGITLSQNTNTSKQSSEVLKSKVEFILIKIKEAEDLDNRIKNIAENIAKELSNKILDSKILKQWEIKKYRTDIFKSEFGSKLFDYYVNEWKDKKSTKKYPIAEMSFLYRKMIEDGFMYRIKHEKYFDFLNHYAINIDKIKQKHQIETNNRTTHYNMIKQSLNSYND